MAVWKRLTASYTGPFDPTHRFETSWILPPAVLFGIRALLSLYAFVTLFTIFGWNGTHGRSGDSERSFSYFTHLTYWGLASMWVCISTRGIADGWNMTCCSADTDTVVARRQSASIIVSFRFMRATGLRHIPSLGEQVP